MRSACAHCAAALDAEQRYCLACGARRPGSPALWAEEDLLGPVLAPAARAPRPRRAARRPTRATAGVLSAGVLASGVLVGIGIGPVALGVTEAAQRAVVLVVPSARAPAAAPAAAVALAAPRGEAPAGEEDGGGDAGSSGGSEDSGSGAAPSAGPTPASTATDTTPAGPTAPTTTTTTTPATPTRPAGPRTALRGTVVHQNTFAGSFVLADARGVLRAVHAASLPPLGSVVRVEARHLWNGTWADDDALPAKPKRVRTATAAGTVTYLDPKGAFYVLSARGASFVVRTSPAPAAAAPDPGATTTTVTAGTTTTAPPPSTTTSPATTPAPTTTTTPATPAPVAPPAPAPLAVGDAVTAKLTLIPGKTDADPGTVTEISHTTDPTPSAPPYDVEAAIVAIDAKAHRLVLSADDSQEERKATLTVTAPASVRLSLLAPFESVAAHLDPGPAGALELTGIAADSGPDTANDEKDADGDFFTGPSHDSP